MLFIRTSLALLIALLLYPASLPAVEAVVVDLTQTPCTIVEAEEKPREFVSHSSDDCLRINGETTVERTFKALRLKAGKTIFRVTNRNVPYPLGFWVRGKGVGRVTLPSVSGGGLGEGETQDYVIDLKPGVYFYSCPLNPTPDYPLIVEGEK
ncbi:MAG: hypothetical protein ACE5D4_04740 [Thermodesulfobacteriota bacterium]